MINFSAGNTSNSWVITIQKPPDFRVVIAAGYIVETNLTIIVVTTISERVNGGDGAAGGIRCHCADAPGVVGVSCDGSRILVYNSHYVALQVPAEIVRLLVVHYAAHALLIVIYRLQSIAAPSLAEDSRAVEYVRMLYAVYRLARPDAVGVVGICVVVKGLELSALLPRQTMAQVGSRVALRVIFYGLTVI